MWIHSALLTLPTLLSPAAASTKKGGNVTSLRSLFRATPKEKEGSYAGKGEGKGEIAISRMLALLLLRYFTPLIWGRVSYNFMGSYRPYWFECGAD